MQAHGALSYILVTPQRPCHPRQSPKEAAIDNQGLPLRRLQSTQVLPASGYFCPQLFDHSFQNLRRKERLCFAKTPQADIGTADLALYPREFGGFAQPPHRAHHRIEQSKKQQRKIIPAQKLAPRILLRARLGHCLGRFGQARPEFLNQLPTGKVALAQRLGRTFFCCARTSHTSFLYLPPQIVQVLSLLIFCPLLPAHFRCRTQLATRVRSPEKSRPRAACAPRISTDER